MSQRLTNNQYQLLEKLYLDDYGFDKDAIFYKNLDKLHKNSLVKKRPLSLTEEGEILAKDFYRHRYYPTKYGGEILDLDFIAKGKGDFSYGKFVADYDIGFVKEIISKYKKSDKYLILDPFGGTGTTSVAAKKTRYKSVAFDVNPVNVMGLESKLDWNLSAAKVFSEYENLVINFLTLEKGEKKKIEKKFNLSKFKNIDKWLNPVVRKELNYLYFLCAEIKDLKIRKLFRFLIGKAGLNVSNVEFCPGVSFYVSKNRSVLKEFKRILEMYVSDLINNNEDISSEVVFGSAMDRRVWEKYYSKVDLIITSPPYPNNIDYVAMSKMELYLHGFVSDKQDLTKLRRKMMCSNAKLVNKKRIIVDEICDLGVVRNMVDLIEIQTRDKKWGFNYVGMVESYFSEMYVVMLNMWDTLVRDGHVVMVVGDQTVKGVKIRTAEILAEIAGMIGFGDIKIENYRSRGASTHKKRIDERVLVIRK